MPEAKEAVEIIPKKATIATTSACPEPGVNIENLNVYLGKDGLAKESALQPRSVLLFGILGVAVALLLGLTLAWFVWESNKGTVASTSLPLGEAFTPLASPLPLQASLTVRGSHNLTASLGEHISARMVVKNTTNDPLDHVVITLKATGSLFDTSTFKLPFGRTDQLPITIDENSLPLLAHIGAQSSIPLSFSFSILPFVPESMKVSPEPSTVSLSLTATATRNNRRVTPFTDAVHITVHSDVEVLAQTRYFAPNGEQIGRGPLPPEVGNKTTYWIYFKIENILNTLENVVLTLRFADTGEATASGWTGRTTTSTGSDFLFDPFLQQASWVLGTVPANRAFTLPPPTSALEVYAVPTAAERGTIPLLLKEIVLSGKDTFTGSLIERRYGVLDADLRTDEQGKSIGYKIQ